MTINKTEIGVMFRREQDPATLIEEAQRVEALGFDQRCWIVEDCFYMGGISQAAIALAATSTIKVGIGINPGVAHNPAILAMEYSTLARAFPGRLIGGIGHGVKEWMEQIGESVASPLTAIEEITTIVRQLLRGEKLTVKGRYTSLADVVLDPPPSVIPPVLLGVRARKSMELAGRCADGVLLAENSAPEYVRWSRDLMNKDRSEPGYLAVYSNALINDENPAAALDTMRRFVANANGNGLDAATEVLSIAGEMGNLIEQGGADALYEKVPDEWIRDLAITGSIEDARASINRLVEAGADSVIFVPVDHSRNASWSLWLEGVSKLVNR